MQCGGDGGDGDHAVEVEDGALVAGVAEAEDEEELVRLGRGHAAR